MTATKRIRVNILAVPETSASTLFGLYDVLNSVGVGWETNVIGAPGDPRFVVRIIAPTSKPFQCTGGVFVTPHNSIDDADDSDVVIVASLVTAAWAPPMRYDARTLDWLRKQHYQGALVASACTGALTLAECGLLDGLEATTHWAYRDLFRKHYPQVSLRLEKNLCISGQNDELITCGGSTAWHELALHLITRLCGIAHARHAVRFWLIPDQEEHQAPYTALSRWISHDDIVVKDCQAWIANNYEKANPVSRMVRKSGLPPATFARRFKLATGCRPMDYVHTLRVEEAKEWLETSALPIDEIGREVGYEDPASFRRLFKRYVKLTPANYRRRFGHSRFERYRSA